MDLTILSQIEKFLLMHCTQAIPLKELKKWTKLVVKKHYALKRISKEEEKWVDISETSLKKKVEKKEDQQVKKTTEMQKAVEKKEQI